MNVLILGGTIYVSKEIARQAKERGHQVTVACRGESGEPPPGVDMIRIDRSNPSSIEALRGKEFDAVVDVASVPFFVKAVLAVLGEVGHYTYVSSVSAYKDPSIAGVSAATGEVFEPVSEDSPDEATGDPELYGRNKVTCENLVRDQFGDRAFIPRPGLIVGPNDTADRFGYWPWRVSQGGQVLAPPKDKKLQWVDVRDLSQWIVTALETGLSGTYDAICQPITWGEFLPKVSEAVGTRAEFVYTTDEFLLDNDVKPFVGDDSLGFWVPSSHEGLLAHDATDALAAGLTIRPLADTIAGWQETNTEADLIAKLSLETEQEVLEAWDTDF